MTDWPTAPIADATIGHNSAETPEEFAARRDAEIQDWLSNRSFLESAKEHEMASRRKVNETLFPTPKKGTQRYPLNAGYAVKLVHTMRPTLGDKEKLDDNGIKIPVRKQVQDVEDAILELGPVAALLVERLIKWTPELSLSEFEKLNRADPVEGEIANLIDAILTITPGSPQLTFEEPKASK